MWSCVKNWICCQGYPSVDRCLILIFFLSQVRELLLGSFKVNLSYFKSSKNSWGHQESSIEVDSDQLGELFPKLQSGQQAASDDAYLQWSENMMTEDDEQQININIIGAVFPSISEAPIRFQERIISHVYESEGDIWMSLKSFYSGEALRQLYKIVGSLGKCEFDIVPSVFW